MPLVLGGLNLYLAIWLDAAWERVFMLEEDRSDFRAQVEKSEFARIRYCQLIC